MQRSELGCGKRRACAPQGGLTLVELVVALAVLSVLLSVAVPSYTRMSAQNHLATSVNLLIAAIAAARQTAVARNAPVTFCAGDAERGCDGDWSAHRWLVFVDRDRDGRVDAGEELRIAEALARDAPVVLSANGPFNGPVVFNPAGLARRPSGAFAAGRIRVCVANAYSPNATDLVLIGSGRLVTEQHDFAGSCPPAGG